jgi:hypothetical protein
VVLGAMFIVSHLADSPLPPQTVPPIIVTFRSRFTLAIEPPEGAVARWRPFSMRMFRSWHALILLPLALQGCYVSRPAELVSIAPGEEVHIVLSDAGLEHLRAVSAETSAEVNGRLQTLTADSLTITTRLRGPAYAGPAFGNLRQAFTFGLSDIDQVTVPELNPGRTAFLAAGALVVAVTAIASLLNFIGGSPDPGEPPDDTAPFRIVW